VGIVFHAFVAGTGGASCSNGHYSYYYTNLPAWSQDYPINGCHTGTYPFNEVRLLMGGLSPPNIDPNLTYRAEAHWMPDNGIGYVGEITIDNYQVDQIGYAGVHKDYMGHFCYQNGGGVNGQDLIVRCP
jgi:hypothetical protein